MNQHPSRVDIREVSLRDGLQIEKPIPLSAKLELLAAVAATGVREVEATRVRLARRRCRRWPTPPNSPPQLHDYPDIEFSALVASPNGAKRAVAAGLRSIEYVVAADDAFSKANVGRTSARGHQARSTRSSPSRTTATSPSRSSSPPRGTHRSKAPPRPQRVLDIAAAARDRGADRLSIADTIGTTTPGRVSSLIAQLRPVIGDLPLGGHFHNTRGAGLASAYAAVSCRGHQAGRLGRRAGRLPVRAGRHRQHRHRGPGVPAARQRHRRRRRPAGRHRRGRSREIGCRP